MTYHVDYEICTIIFLIMLLIVSYIRKRLDDFQSRMYQTFLIVCFANTCLDVVTCYTDSYYTAVPVWLNYFLNAVFLMLQCIIPIMITFYLNIKVQQYREFFRWELYIVAFPAIIAAIVALSSPFTHLFFYFDATGYHHGILHSWLYINAAYYAIGTAIYSIWLHKLIRWSQTALTLILIAVTLIPTIIQYFMPNYMLSGIGTALSIFIIYLTNENSMIYLDATTGALNRQAFSQHIKSYHHRSMPEQIFVIALDNFKLINELYGMAGGNELMRLLVEALQKAYSKTCIYRYGGDTFVIVLKETTEGSIELQRIQQILNRRWKIYDSYTQLSACVSLIHSIHHTDESLTDAIDYSIEQVKKAGKGQFIEITENNASELSRRMAIEQAILSSIERNEFEVHYQPIYDTKEHRFHSLEALARLQVPDYGYVSPEEFIRIAEKNGTILKIGLLVLEEVCKCYKQLDLKSYGIDFIEVNLSVVQCMHENIAQDILAILNKYGIEPSMINLEITESAAAYSEERLIQNMIEMRKAGLSFSLDDYGSGYSNINYLVDLPFSIVKIDKYLVWAAMKDNTSNIILANIVSMFKKIDLKVVTEGIEDLNMSDTVTDFGADYIQGYYYSRPVPKRSLPDCLSEEYVAQYHSGQH